MQKFVKDYLNELTRQKKRRREVAIAVVLLAVLVIGGVAGILEQYGIAMTGQAVCGIEEHKHNDACYKETLICGQEAGKSHSHEAACYDVERQIVANPNIKLNLSFFTLFPQIIPAFSSIPSDYS